MPRFLYRRHAAPIALDDASSASVAPSTPRRYGTSHAPASREPLRFDGPPTPGWVPCDTAPSRLHPGTAHFTAILGGGAALKETGTFEDPFDRDGDIRRAVTKAWDAPTANLKWGGRPQSAVSRPLAALTVQVEDLGTPEGQQKARPSRRPHSANLASREVARSYPKIFGDTEARPPAGDADSVTPAPRSTTGATTRRRARIDATSHGTLSMALTSGRDAPLPGYFAAASAPSAATIALTAAAMYAAGDSGAATSGHRGRRRTGASTADPIITRLAARVHCAGKPGDAPTAVSGARNARAIIKHGTPFGWLRSFEFSKLAPAGSAHVASPRLGSGPQLYGLNRRKPTSARAGGADDGNDVDHSTDAFDPAASCAGQVHAQGGPHSDTTVAQPRRVLDPRIYGRPRVVAPGHTNFRAGSLSAETRRDLCSVDMQRAAGREDAAARQGSSSNPVPLAALDAALAYTSRHVPASSIGKQSPRPPLNRPSPSSGMSLFVKYTLVEPTVPSPRFRSATDNRPQPSSPTNSGLSSRPMSAHVPNPPRRSA
jgi:hypothetical protein